MLSRQTLTPGIRRDSVLFTELERHWKWGGGSGGREDRGWRIEKEENTTIKEKVGIRNLKRGNKPVNQ